jgi:transposase
MAYGQAFRNRVLSLYDNGLKTAEIARRLCVSRSWCRRVKKRRDQPPGKITGRPPRLDADACQLLIGRVEQQPDATLEELRCWCKSELNISVSTGTLWSVLRRLKLTFKKSR